MGDTRTDAATPAEVLPRPLFSRQSLRRASVFSDLMTIFRRSTSGSSVRRKKANHARTPPIEDLKNESNQETEAFLDADASAAAATTGANEEEEEGKPMTRQVLLDKIRQKKEVIGKLRCQAWSMNRKRRTLKLAQKYLEQHESKVSKTHLYKEEFKKRWHATCRWADNIRIYLIPWEAKIKRIESHFGSVVSSYFTFLRWVVYVNLIITLIIISFIVIPEVIADATADAGRKNRTESRKIIPFKERIHADELQVVLHFGGYFKYSPLFYGYYSDDEFIRASVRYSVPLAYFIITLFIFGYSFFAILRKMAANARMSKLASGKTEQYTFNWKVFTGWDYTIGNPDTASNTAMAIVIKLRESIADCRIVTQKKFRILLFATRIFANAVILGMLAFSIYVISFAVQSSQTVEKTGSLFTKNQVPTIVATITHLFPMIFDLIGTIERYHPRTALRAHLTRVLVLYVVNYLTLIIALFEKLDSIRENEITKFDDIRHRAKRQLKDSNLSSPILSTFESRNFTTLSEAINFMNDSIERFTEEQHRYSAKPTALTDSVTTKTRRDTTKLSTPIQRSTTTRKSPHSHTIIQPQYGPIGLNNPSAVLFNATLSPYRRRYQTIKIGPTPLPTFNTPPMPRRPSLKTNVNLELGPDWRSYGKRPKSTASTKIRRPITSRYRPPTTRLTTTAPPTTTATTSASSTSTTTRPPKETTAEPIPSTTPITTNPPTTKTHQQSTEQPKLSLPTALPSPTFESATPTASDASISSLNSSTDLSLPSNKTTLTSNLSSTQHSSLLSKLQSDNITLIKSLSIAEEVQNEVEHENRLDTPSEQTLSDSNVTLTHAPKIGIRKNISSVDTFFTNILNETSSLQTTSPTVRHHGLTSDKQRTDKILTTAATSTHSLGETTSEKSRTDADKDLNLSKADEKLDKAKQFERHEQKNNGREMIILSPDEDPIEVSNNASLISAMNNLDNDTYYEIGGSARSTTEQEQSDDHFCWETMIGQEIVKLVTMDLVITIASIFVIDFFRGLWIKYCSSWWCWDIETTFPEYGEFKVAENVLHIIYNQGLVWIGLFFAPLLPAINNIKLIILLYIRGWACMTCNVPAREIFRASRSSNFYLLILLLWLLLCTLPVGYVIASKRPSSRCGPFAGYDRFYNVFTHMLEGRLDEKIVNWLHYMASPGVIIPVLLLLMLVIYFLVSLVRGLKEANDDLQQQLIHERTEEKKKIFELAGGGNKRKPNEFGRAEKKKKVVTYLPIVEQKRREPWRAFNGLEYDSSVCVTDETSTVTTPASNAPSPQVPLRTVLALPPQTTSKQTISSAQQPTSFGSVDENDENKKDIECDRMNEYQSKPQSISKSISLAKSNTTDRVDDWFNEADEETKSDYSYNVQEDVVQLVTPEEIRLNGNGSKIRPSAVCQPQPSTYPHLHQPSLDPIIAADREKEIEEECPVDEAPTNQNQQQETGRRAETTSISSTKKFDPKLMATEFVPWPSMDEIQEQRLKQSLSSQAPASSSSKTSSRMSRRISPPKSKPIKTIEGSPTREEASMMPTHQRRFRISVSPTRRLHTDPSGSDTDTSTGKRRYVIKQQVMPGSTSSVLTTPDMTQPTSIAGITNSLSPRAPRVQFGDDDSPRIEHQPEIEPKVHATPLNQ